MGVGQEFLSLEATQGASPKAPNPRQTTFPPPPNQD